MIEFNHSVSGFYVYGSTHARDLSHDNAAEMLAINISPHHWRKCLVSNRNNYSSIYLWVIKQNKTARDFYSSWGFEYDGLEKTDTELTRC